MNIELLKRLGTVKRFNKDEYICLEQEKGNTAYLLLQGKTDIVCGSFEDQCHKVAELQPGAIFGEMSLLENKARNASAQATVDDTLVLEIEKSNFLEILRIENETAWNLMNTLLARMDKMMNELQHGNYVSVAGYKKNIYYLQLKKLTKEQFEKIAGQDPEQMMTLLKFLSSSLAEMDEVILRERKK